MRRRVALVLVVVLLGSMMAVLSGCSRGRGKDRGIETPIPPAPPEPEAEDDKGAREGEFTRPGTRGPSEVPADFDQKMVTVYFDFDKSDIREDQLANLEANASYLKDNQGFNVTIEGHCDERGTLEYNMALGQRRASSVREFLISRGVDGGRLAIVSYGEERPVDPGRNEAAYARNRRSEFVGQ